MPPELIFILVLIVFSILENALKGKKKGGSVGKPPGSQLPPGWPPPGPTGRETPGPEREGGTTVPANRERASDMVPEELWDEIAALARGDVDETLRRRRARARADAEQTRRRRGAGPRPGPSRPPAREPTRDVPQPEDEPEEAPITGGGTVFPPAETEVPVPTRSRFPRSREPRSREGYHAERIREVNEAEDARKGPGETRPARTPRPQAESIAAMRRVPLRDSAKRTTKRIARKAPSSFRGGRALRQAIIAREVLGRPLALREYGDEEMWSD